MVASGLPFTSTAPRSSVSSPANTRSNVDLPTPEGPSRATTIPGSMVAFSATSE